MESLVKIYLKCYGQFIVCSKGKNDIAVAFLDVKFAKMEYVKADEIFVANWRENKLLTKSQHFGLRIIKTPLFEDIVHSDAKALRKLAQYLEKYVVLGHFKRFYTPGEILGEGKFGTVFSAVNNSTDKEFAVKLYRTDTLFEDNFQKCVLYEIDRIRQISGKKNIHCLKFVKIFEGKNYIYCLGEVLKGGELRKAMKMRAGFSEFEILSIIYKVLAGVMF